MTKQPKPINPDEVELRSNECSGVVNLVAIVATKLPTNGETVSYLDKESGKMVYAKLWQLVQSESEVPQKAIVFAAS
jgi:hypothetical protein